MNDTPNPGMVHSLCVATIAALMAAGMTACSKQDDASAQAGASGDAAQATEAKAGDEGGSAVDTLPDWYLAEFPQHPDLRLERVSQPGAGAWLMAYAGGGDGQALTDWFKAHYSQDGWTIDMEQGDSRFAASKGAGYQATVSVTGTKYVTIVTVTAHAAQ